MGPADAVPPPAIQCRIDVRDSAGHVAISGELVSTAAASGTYRLDIAKSGRSGTSSIAQSGQFATGAGTPALVGGANLDASPATRLLIRFTVRSPLMAAPCTVDREFSYE